MITLVVGIIEAKAGFSTGEKLLKFCNLEWDNNCLNFYKNKKTPIQTVSVSQARKPIYNSSVNSNSDYSKYLQDMYNILDTQ